MELKLTTVQTAELNLNGKINYSLKSRLQIQMALRMLSYIPRYNFKSPPSVELTGGVKNLKIHNPDKVKKVKFQPLISLQWMLERMEYYRNEFKNNSSGK